MQWEYQTYKLKATGIFGGNVDEADMEHALNRFGQEGWELVNGFDTNAADGHTKWVVFLFKRPKG
ncbi:MAG: DUF4177 domain-containing protein [Planctomycetota bacterium]